MGYLNQFRLSQNGEFQGTLRQALLVNAWLVINEAADVPNHLKRKRLADLIFQGSPQMDSLIYPMFLRFTTSNAGIAESAVKDGQVIASNVQDAALDTVIKSSWNGIADLVQ